MLSIDRVSATLTRFTMDRPPANAMTHEMILAVADNLAALNEEAEPPAVILTGAGERFFCAGGDIREITDNPSIAVPRMHGFHRMLVELERYKAPSLCAVNGYAVGGAMELLLHSDYVIASETAQFGFPEINNGLLPASKGIRKAAERLGRRIAERLLYSGDIIPADRALEFGLVDEVVSVDEVQDRTMAQAEKMRSKDMHLFWAIKEALNEAGAMSDDELEAHTIDHMKAYLSRDASNTARESFLNRKAK